MTTAEFISSAGATGEATIDLGNGFTATIWGSDGKERGRDWIIAYGDQVVRQGWCVGTKNGVVIEDIKQALLEMGVVS